MFETSVTTPRETALRRGVLFLAALLAAGLLAAGCGTGNPYPPGSYERGQFFAERENYPEAVLALESFVRHNPTDSLAAGAQYLKAMSTMKMKEFPLAAVEFQILRKDYPTSPLVEDAFFQEGVAYYGQVGRVERDITGALDARRHFQQFLTRYPDSQLRPEVDSYLQKISDLVVRKRLRQCKVFKQLKRPEAIALTLDSVLDAEPRSSLIDEVLWQRAKIAEKLGDAADARPYYQRLVDQYPESDHADEARAELSDAEPEETEEAAETSS